jgi:hypothetical protein
MLREPRRQTQPRNPGDNRNPLEVGFAWPPHRPSMAEQILRFLHQAGGAISLFAVAVILVVVRTVVSWTLTLETGGRWPWQAKQPDPS